MPITVYFVLLPDHLILDWAGPAEAFRIANQHCIAMGARAIFELRWISPAEQVKSSVGALIANVEPLPALLKEPCWVVISGQSGRAPNIDSPMARKTIAWLSRLQLGSKLGLVNICAGALIAAKAGLLRHRKTTTHHEHLDQLSALEPLCTVEHNRVFVYDQFVWSSAGVTTGIDLSLHLIAQECGALVASQVAQTMVVGMRRGPNDPEMSPFLQHRNHLHRAVHQVQDQVNAQLQRDWTVAGMANIANMTPRHLTRVFAQHVGVTPANYVRAIRLACAQQALQAGMSVEIAAQQAGFASATNLRRAWKAQGLAASPSTGV
jgi:transcriptional regulator GlxA family with amidase domain